MVLMKLGSQREVAQLDVGRGFIYYGIRHADRDLLLISPRVALQITVERLISTIEVLNLVEFFEKADSYRRAIAS